MDKLLNNEPAKLLEQAGYAYDPEQDIYYSTMYAWQRKFGYCRLYDEAAALFSMIMDCEPVRFEYAGKRWLIQFWKGQYGLATGCEVGIYNTAGPDVAIPGVFNGTFYHSAEDREMLKMSYTLSRKGKPLFVREGVHWWLTGFKLGVFSEPGELTMDLKIVLRDKSMRKAFVGGLEEAGYSEGELLQKKKSVRLRFSSPRTPQPYTRTPATDALVQKRNKLFCEAYQEITGGKPLISESLQAIKEKAPEVYAAILALGKNKELFASYHYM